MKQLLIKAFTGINAFLIQISHGMIGTRLGTQRVLLLRTRGRKTGKAHTTPIAYFDHEGSYLLVGSNWGRDYQADWFLNLVDHPAAKIELRGETIAVVAHSAGGEEYARLWRYATQRHPPYLAYQQMTRRPIPVVVLQPVAK